MGSNVRCFGQFELRISVWPHVYRLELKQHDVIEMNQFKILLSQISRL